MRRSRIAIIDDDKPELIDDLKQQGYAVDYFSDITTQELHNIMPGRYDVMLLDFAGVGRDFGDNEGLSLLQFIRRTNPAVIVIAYTATGIGTKHAEFFRQADFVLAKDAGIADSTDVIDLAIRKALSVDNLWKALLQQWEIASGTSRDAQLQDLVVRGLDRGEDKQTVKQKLVRAVGDAATEQIADLTANTLLDMLV